jgi:rhodanese-related sulfurtransferase
MTEVISWFGNSGIISQGLLHLSPCEAHQICRSNAVLIDVREEYLCAYKKFNVPQVLFIPLHELSNRINELPANVPLITADACGLRSKEAAILLKSVGFENVANMAGGMVEWERDHLPLIINDYEMLSGSCMCQLKQRSKTKTQD